MDFDIGKRGCSQFGVLFEVFPLREVLERVSDSNKPKSSNTEIDTLASSLLCHFKVSPPSFLLLP